MFATAQAPNLPEDESVPDEFICPLTLQIMEDPIMNRDGNNFERNAIIEWLRTSGAKCPSTSKDMYISDFIANSRLRAQIQAWKFERNEDEDGGRANMDKGTEQDYIEDHNKSLFRKGMFLNATRDSSKIMVGRILENRVHISFVDRPEQSGRRQRRFPRRLVTRRGRR